MPTVITLRFVAGRYHATPWDRQVNEGEVEWPPSPWRLLRSFIAVWHRKISPGGEGEDVLESLVERLAGDLPRYRLPAAAHAHSRHYVPVAGDKKTLIFDAWAAVDREEDLVVVWPEVDLPEAERALLAKIVGSLGYLGRSEGWVEGSLTGREGTERGADGQPVGAGEVQPRIRRSWDCVPAAEADEECVERSEVIRLAVPVGPESYRRWRADRIREEGLDAKRLSAKDKRLLATLPPRLLDALRAETIDLRGVGWSDPPGCRFEAYRRRGDALDPKGAGGGPGSRPSGEWQGPAGGVLPTTVRFALGGRPRPRIEDAVRAGEVMRVAMMATTDRRGRRGGAASTEDGPSSNPQGREPLTDRPAAVAKALALLSGHDLPPGTMNAFYLPEDADGDGFIDHILLHIPGGIPPAALEGAGRIRMIWRETQERWPAVAEVVGPVEIFPRHPYLTRSRVWTSVTPYLHPWFRKKGFGIEEQIRKECRLRGWGEPELERSGSVKVAGKDLRPVHFHRFRSRPGLTQPDRSGSFWRLTFPEPVAGPVTLGFGRFFGLGLFRGLIAD